MRFDDIEEESESRFSKKKLRGVDDIPENPILTDPLRAMDLVGRVVGQAYAPKDGTPRTGAEVRDLRISWLRFLRSLEPLELPGQLGYYRRAMTFCDRMNDRAFASVIRGKTILGVGGQFSAGKSAFINAVMGLGRLLPENQSPTTSIPTYVTCGEKTEYVLTSMGGRVCHSISAEELNALSHTFHDKYKIGFSAFIDSCIISSPDFAVSPKIVLLDTPGYSKPDDLERTFTLSDRERALEQLKKADRLIWLIQQENGTISAEDLKFLDDINPDQPVLIVITHADQKGKTEMDGIIESVKSMTSSLPGGVYGVTGYSSPLASEYDGGHLIKDFLNDVARTDNRKNDIVYQFEILEVEISKALMLLDSDLAERVRELKRHIASTTEILAIRSLSLLLRQSMTKQKLVRMAIKNLPDERGKRQALVNGILCGLK